MSIVAFSEASVRLGGRTVFSGASFEIGEGEFIGVLGPNGAGKTTLMRTILGLVKTGSGLVRVFGEPPRRGNPAIGYLPQMRANLPGLRISGFDYIAASVKGERWGLPSITQAERRMIERTLAELDANALAARPLSEMSGGERQLLLLAQALLGSPRLLLLDEPLISLDPHHQEAIIALVRRIGRERGMTVLFSAHELNQLLGALDRVLYLGRGQAVLGSVDEVVTAPVLSRLYGAAIDVVHADGHIFVLSRGRDVERADHLHDHNHHHDSAHTHV
jgi:zinc/manganese transport system ATP-binding protein